MCPPKRVIDFRALSLCGQLLDCERIPWPKITWTWSWLPAPPQRDLIIKVIFKTLLQDTFKEFAATTILHHKMVVSLVLVGLIESYNVWMVKLRQNIEFSQYHVEVVAKGFLKSKTMVLLCLWTWRRRPWKLVRSSPQVYCMLIWLSQNSQSQALFQIDKIGGCWLMQSVYWWVLSYFLI